MERHEFQMHDVVQRRFPLVPMHALTQEFGVDAKYSADNILLYLDWLHPDTHHNFED
jgi:hypothetical protein